MNCRWDHDTETYQRPDGEDCRTDDDGWPTKHCTVRRSCGLHVGHGELTCARCLGRTRQDIRQIVERSALMLPEAMVAGVDSEAANMAGPAADVEAWSWRKVTAKQGRVWHMSTIEDDDDHHPYTVLVRWAHMLSEDYGTERPDVWTIANAAAFLDRILHRVAQDDGQDFPLLVRELRKCRAHLESVLRDSLAPEKGAPCPECKANDEARLRRDPAYKGKLVRLVRWYAHWCADPDCEQQFHPVTDELDRWVCPRDKAHSWDVESYSKYVEERMGA